MDWCKTQCRRLRSAKKDATNEQIALTNSREIGFSVMVRNIKEGNVKVAWKWSRLNVQFWIKIISKYNY